uniref:Methyltransferase type 12 domain-containing protein n=1 Tax=Chenopodium quinoa TaxID=63459 RepID=A0A803KPJ7_CHEQI
MKDNVLRKGINPRTRVQQLEDLRQYKGISHYEGDEANNHTALPCPGELLVEEHHSNYGEPWAGGRDVFEFLAESAHLSPDAQVLEIGCGTLRVGLHFIRYLKPEHFHCLERDELSLMAAFRYELPSQGLLHKRPIIVKGEDMDFSRFGSEVTYDLIYASAVFLHMPDKLVWVGLERLASKLKPDGRIFVSHNIKFCSRLGGDECTKRLSSLGLEYVGKRTHDSLLFNHYEIWKMRSFGVLVSLSIVLNSGGSIVNLELCTEEGNPISLRQDALCAVSHGDLYFKLTSNSPNTRS